MNNKSNIDIQLQQIIEETIGEEIRKRQREKHLTSDEVKSVMYEEYTISKTVVSKTQEVCGWMETMMKGKKGEAVDNNGTAKYAGELPMNCFGRKVLIKYDIVNYRSREMYNILCCKKFEGEVNNGKILKIQLAAINKKVTKESYDAVQHELHHLYESVMADNGKSLGNHNDRYMYDKALSNMKILKARDYSESGDNIRYLLNLVVYYSLDSEIRTYTNTLDSYIRTHDVHDSEGVRKSVTYEALKLIKSVLSAWVTIEPYVEEEFGVDSDVCKDMLIRGKDGYVRGIGRILAKYNMKAINENKYLSFNINWYNSFEEMFDSLDREVSQFLKG